MQTFMDGAGTVHCPRRIARQGERERVMLLENNFTFTFKQCCGSGSVLDPYSGALWIRIRIQNTDPHM